MKDKLLSVIILEQEDKCFILIKISSFFFSSVLFVHEKCVSDE